MNILKELPELIEAGIITQHTADSITDYYNKKNSGSSNKLLIVFGILGAILVGLGIVLIIAHNWDNLSKITKLCFAFLPLVIGQILCMYTLLKQSNSTAWREGSASFLFFAVGTVIALVSQIYNMGGTLSSFLFIWMLLCIPVVYAMQSSVASLLCIICITWYAVEICYFKSNGGQDYYYWLLMAAVLPYYYLLYKQKPFSSFIVLHHWLVPLSLIIALGTIAKNKDELMFVAYINMFGLFYIVGNTAYFNNQKALVNGYRGLGSVGTIGILLFLSFDFFWEHLRKDNEIFSGLVTSTEFIVCVITTLISLAAFYFQKSKRVSFNLRPVEFVFLAFIICFFVGTVSSTAVVLINLLILATGVLTIINGVKENHLGILNYGLIIIAALVTCRFFDSDLSFVARGILFVLVGAGFFVANYQMIKKRKENA